MKYLKYLLVVAVLFTNATTQQSPGLGYGSSFNSYMAAVPSSQTTLTTLTGAYRFYCNNTTGTAAIFTITDNQGSPVSFVTSFSLAANSNITFPPAGFYMKMQGVKWGQITPAAVNCLADGYTQ